MLIDEVLSVGDIHFRQKSYNKMKELREKVAFSFWEKYDESHTVVRFATSWSTTEKDIELLKEIL